MPPRYQPKCRFCPTTASEQELKPTPTMQSVLAITSPGEGERLWKHVLFGTSTCVSMIEGYSSLGMPGSPKDALVALRDRIQKVLSKYEEAHAPDESGDSPEPPTSRDDPESEALPG